MKEDGTQYVQSSFGQELLRIVGYGSGTVALCVLLGILTPNSSQSDTNGGYNIASEDGVVLTYKLKGDDFKRTMREPLHPNFTFDSLSDGFQFYKVDDAAVTGIRGKYKDRLFDIKVWEAGYRRARLRLKEDGRRFSVVSESHNVPSCPWGVSVKYLSDEEQFSVSVSEEAMEMSSPLSLMGCISYAISEIDTRLYGDSLVADAISERQSNKKSWEYRLNSK